MSVARCRGAKGLVASTLSAFGGEMGNQIVWRFFKNPIMVTAPGLDFFTEKPKGTVTPAPTGSRSRLISVARKPHYQEPSDLDPSEYQGGRPDRDGDASSPL